MTIDLSKLALPFPAEDIEWRVARAGNGKGGIYCSVFPYVTARAHQQRFDEVCGIGNWALTQPILLAHDGKCAIGLGLSIRIDNEWVTKWDVCELTDRSQNIPPFKGGFSGAEKRAGSQWGCGRYLYHLEEMWAEVSEYDVKTPGWHWAKLSEKQGGAEYWWKEPQLPAWALPKEAEAEIDLAQLNHLKRAWIAKFAPDVKNRADLVTGFRRFVTSIVGEFPVEDHNCWTNEAWEKCRDRINQTTDPNGVSADVPFEE